MSPENWTHAGAPFDAGRPAAIGGYTRHAVRTERTLGWILWIGLLAVLFWSSL